jgi:hypothetical protein
MDINETPPIDIMQRLIEFVLGHAWAENWARR